MPFVLPSRPSVVSVGEDEAGEICTILSRAGDRGQDRNRHRGDDAADDDRHFFHLHELIGGVDRERALALRVARVGDELAAVRAAGIVDIAERHLDRLRAGLAVLACRSGQLHHHADRDLAILRPGAPPSPSPSANAAADIRMRASIIHLRLTRADHIWRPFEPSAHAGSGVEIVFHDRAVPARCGRARARRHRRPARGALRRPPRSPTRSSSVSVRAPARDVARRDAHARSRRR